jgi:hypothetical protein
MAAPEPNRGGRPAKRLVDHILERSFQPKRHGAVLSGDDLTIKPPHTDPTPAMNRVWGRMRELQAEYRDVTGPDIRRDVILAFSRATDEYMDAVERAHLDPTKDLDGLADILAINRRARATAQA